jgi:diguanylate cyclase (GGDEF)-like protein
MRDDAFRQSLLDAILEASPDGILVVDGAGVIVSHNQHFCQLFRLSLGDEKKQGASLVGLKDEVALAEVLPLLAEPEAFIARVVELYGKLEIEDYDEIAFRDGRTLERHSKSLWGADGNHLGRVWFFRDISARKALEKTLADSSCKDPLTEVSNRRHFMERAGEEFARAQRTGQDVSVIYVDIDHFKSINDSFGHSFGDKVIIHFCRTAEIVLRKQDLLGRLGGEEFAILLPDTELQGAHHLAERLREFIAGQTLQSGPHQVRYTVSAGVALLTTSDASLESALARADTAMYRAKKAGRNRVISDQGRPTHR